MVNVDKYVSHEKGAIPLILSVPHGGELIYEEIPTRSLGILGIDKKTIQLAQELIQEFQSIYFRKTSENKKPSFVFCNVTRRKIDLNRPIEKAFNHESQLAKYIYHFYHKTIQEYIFHNIEAYNRSLLIDIHGFERNKRPQGFRDVDIILGTDNLKSMYSNSLKKKDLSKNLRGLIVKKFLELNIPIAPGHQRRREYVLSGGYITKKYGASNIPKSQSMQIEFSDRIRLYDNDLRKTVLKTLAEIIFDEFSHFNF